MGGCKCTYRNCTVKSDGKTHMFHYPVFDKVRCHQWILNAQRHEFLNLKVSQLKNRVVCQHHFKDDYFMNYKKEKLTFDAVPTEDGPFCDTTKWNNENKNNIPAFPVTTDDIENEYLTYSEKIANYSLKYADFLTNCDFDFLNSTNLDAITLNNKSRNDTSLEQSEKSSDIKRYSDKLSFQRNSYINVLNSPKPTLAIVNPYDMADTQMEKDIKLQESIIDDNADSKHQKLLLSKEHQLNEVTTAALNNTRNEEQIETKVNTEYLISQNTPISVTTRSQAKKEPKVKILSEKKIKDLISIPKNLQSVPPSLVIKMRKTHENSQPVFLDISKEQQDNLATYNVDLKIDRIDNPMCSVDSKAPMQANQAPIFSIDLSGQRQDDQVSTYSLKLNEPKQESQSITHSINLKRQNHKSQLKTYSIDMNGLKQENQQMLLRSSSPTMNLNMQKQNNEPPLYTIDINGHKQKNRHISAIDFNDARQDNQQPVYSIDLNVPKPDCEPVPLLQLNADQKNKQESVIKMLKDKYVVNLEYNNTPENEKNNSNLHNTVSSQLSPKKVKPQALQLKELKKIHLLKNKFTPNRLAAIEEKRKFNMKLRDAVENCLKQPLDKKLEPKAPKDNVLSEPQTEDVQKNNTAQISSYLSTDPQLPNIHEYTLTFLESRFQRMENRLLSKIDQNSQKIEEMKKSFVPKPEKKTSSMQTNNSNGSIESYKRYLYQEISQFLSPNCNSAIYEELFINKYSLDKKIEDIDEHKKKRRRCR